MQNLLFEFSVLHLTLIQCRHRRHQTGQLCFHLIQYRAGLLRQRQSQQRHHAVSIDFQYALHHASGLLRNESAVPQNKPCKAIRMHSKIGQEGAAIQHNTPRQHPSGAQRRSIMAEYKIIGLWNQNQMRRREYLRLQLIQPALRQVLQYRRKKCILTFRIC